MNSRHELACKYIAFLNKLNRKKNHHNYTTILFLSLKMNVCMFCLKSFSMNFIKVIVHEPTKEKQLLKLYFTTNPQEMAPLSFQGISYIAVTVGLLPQRKTNQINKNDSKAIKYLCNVFPSNIFQLTTQQSEQGEQLHAVSRTQQDRQPEPSSKTLHSPLTLD